VTMFFASALKPVWRGVAGGPAGSCVPGIACPSAAGKLSLDAVSVVVCALAGGPEIPRHTSNPAAVRRAVI